MRTISLPRFGLLATFAALLLALSSVAAAAADLNPDLVGTWEHPDTAGVVIRFILNADGTGKIDDDAITYTSTANAIDVRLGGEMLHYQFRHDGEQIIISGGDLDKPAAFTRKSAPAAPNRRRAEKTRAAAQSASQPAPKPGSILGKWNSDDGLVELKEDGTGSIAGRPFRYKVDGAVILITDGDGKLTRVAYTIDGDRMIVLINGEIGALTRAAADEKGQANNNAVANGIAGVYVTQEASVDPTNAMVLTQYLTLYPDGAVGWAKSEMGATRQQVSDAVERFTSFRNGADHRGQTYGRWQASGNQIVVQWSIWNNLTCNGRITADGSIQLEKMGTLNEGATLEFKKQ